MQTRRYEIRIAGRLSPRARDAFVDMDVHAVPAETVIAGTVRDDEALHRLLALIQSLGLSVVSIDQVTPDPWAPAPTHGVDDGASAASSAG
jgi:hypothetical protein